MFRVKICGVTCVEDAIAATKAGADAIGLNFYSRSRRCVSLETAAEIANQLPRELCRVGVFVNDSPSRIRDVFARLDLDFVQLHGDEPVDFAQQLGLPVIKAIRFQGDPEAIRNFVEGARRTSMKLAAVLIDAFHESMYGGSGKSVDWDAAAKLRAELAPLPVVLAGGLKPENIAQAIQTVFPYGVDVASGVEDESGRKCPTLVNAFVARAHQALKAERTSGARSAATRPAPAD